MIVEYAVYELYLLKELAPVIDKGLDPKAVWLPDAL
jgi:hypothetical protein